jgi:hypothetical protein
VFSFREVPRPLSQTSISNPFLIRRTNGRSLGTFLHNSTISPAQNRMPLASPMTFPSIIVSYPHPSDERRACYQVLTCRWVTSGPLTMEATGNFQTCVGGTEVNCENPGRIIVLRAEIRNAIFPNTSRERCIFLPDCMASHSRKPQPSQSPARQPRISQHILKLPVRKKSRQHRGRANNMRNDKKISREGQPPMSRATKLPDQPLPRNGPGISAHLAVVA